MAATGPSGPGRGGRGGQRGRGNKGLGGWGDDPGRDPRFGFKGYVTEGVSATPEPGFIEVIGVGWVNPFRARDYLQTGHHLRDQAGDPLAVRWIPDERQWRLRALEGAERERALRDIEAAELGFESRETAGHQYAHETEAGVRRATGTRNEREFEHTAQPPTVLDAARTQGLLDSRGNPRFGTERALPDERNPSRVQANGPPSRGDLSTGSRGRGRGRGGGRGSGRAGRGRGL